MGTSGTVYFTLGKQQAEPLRLLIVLVIAIVAGAVVVPLIYFMRGKKAAKQIEEDNSEASPPLAHLDHET